CRGGALVQGPDGEPHPAIAAEAAGRQFDLRRGGQDRHLLRLFARPSWRIHQSTIDILGVVDRGTHDPLLLCCCHCGQRLRDAPPPDGMWEFLPEYSAERRLIASFTPPIVLAGPVQYSSVRS